MSIKNSKDNSEEVSKNIVQGIKSLLKDSLGLTADIKLMEPRSIARSEGKAVRVIDKTQAPILPVPKIAAISRSQNLCLRPTRPDAVFYRTAGRVLWL
jgi:hypothetical protein